MELLDAHSLEFDMSITDISAYKRQQALASDLRKLEALETASLDNLSHEQIERIKRDPRLGTYPYARLVMAAFKRQEAALAREAAERKAEVEREARMRI